MSPGEFDYLLRQAVERGGARVIVIDSLNGYLNAMSEERLVLVQLHELLTYLGQQGVLTLMSLAQHGLIGDRAQSPLDVSYLADTVVLLRYFEAIGELRQAISVVKKRSGMHERSIREFKLGPGVVWGHRCEISKGFLPERQPILVRRGRYLTRASRAIRVAAGMGSNLDERILVLAPVGRDAGLAQAALDKVHIPAYICANMNDLSRRSAPELVLCSSPRKHCLPMLWTGC